MSNIIPQTGEKAQGLNGPVFITKAGEWAVYLDGECIGWASTEMVGWKMHTEALVTRSAHYRRNPFYRHYDPNQEAANV